jgi:GxxExxY protein
MLILLIDADTIKNMVNKVEDFLYEQESYKIRGACFDVYNKLGGGIKENIIERAVTKELKDRGFSIENQKRIDVSSKEEKIGIYIPDVVVDGKIMLELKSRPFITKLDEKQFWGYLQGSEYELGFLINFGPQKLTIKRYICTK